MLFRKIQIRIENLAKNGICVVEQKHETKKIYASHSTTLRDLYFSVEKIGSHFELLFCMP